MIPKTIGRYRIKAELGRGGMSTVYLAHDPHFERDVAVKLLPLELLHQSTFRRRFEREAKVVATLDHPAIVPVYDFGEEDGQPFLVMRFMKGGSLAERLRQSAITIKEAAAIIKRLAPALDEVHAHGVVHRDLKPSNILFDNRNDPYISDFGTAKVTQANTKLTETGGAVGTPAYMSPEQIQGNADLDGRSDIYSLGVILFEMLTGKHPYQTNTPIAVAVKHIFEPVPQILDMVPDLPIECQELIGRAMAKNRGDRYVTAVAFANALSRIANRIETHTMRAIPDTAVQGGKRHALLIQTEQYKDQVLSQLANPSTNINTLAKLLRDPAVGGFDNVHVVVNQTTDGIRRQVSQFFANKHPDDLLLFYYVGHAAIGVRSRLYLTATNTEHNLLRGTAIPASFIVDELDNCTAQKQIVVLDCHYSNSVETELPRLLGQTVNAGANFTRNGHNRIVITATDSTQYSWQREGVQGKAAPSQFTRHLIDGLETGLADLDSDGRITINELFAFIYDRVVRNSVDEQIQTPRKWAPFGTPEEGEVVIAKSVSRLLKNSPANEVYDEPQAQVRMAPVGSGVRRSVSGWSKQYGRIALATGILLLLFSAVFNLIQRPLGNETTPNDIVLAAGDANQPLTSPMQLPTPTSSAELEMETAVAGSIATVTPTPVATTVAVTAVSTETSPPQSTSPIATESPSIAYALESSSIYSGPGSEFSELTFVEQDEPVEVLGRSEDGTWIYVRTQDGTEGFTFLPRFDWNGPFEALAIYEPLTESQPETAVSSGNCPPGQCPALTVAIYDLPGTRCTPDAKYRNVYIQGSGGDGVYTYYWGNQKLSGPLFEKGYSFEVSSPDGAAQIIQARVQSGDGQSVTVELFVDQFNDCG